MTTTINLLGALRGVAAALGASLLLALPAVAQDAAEAAKALLPAKYRDAGVLNVSASTVYAPHSFFKEGTIEWTGYEIELFNEVAAILGVKPVYTEAPFQQLIAGVSSGRADVSLGDLGDNDLRQEQVDFVDYGLLTFVLGVDKGNPEGITNLYDLCGRDLGIVQGTTNVIKIALAKCVEQGKAEPKYVEFPDQTAKDQAINSGRLPRADVKQTTISRYQEANGLSPALEYVAAPEIGNLYIGVIVQKGNAELAAALAAAYQVLFDNGKYAEILAKWNLADQSIKAPGVNIGSEATNWVQPKP